MAELYLSLAGNDTWDGLSTGAAKKTWAGIAAIIASGDVVHILPGSYTGSSNYINLNAAKFAAIKILCNVGVYFAPGASYPVVNITALSPGVHIKSLVGQNSRAFLLSASGLRLEDCENISPLYKGIDANNCANLTITGGRYASNDIVGSTSAHAYFYGNTTAKIDRTLFGGGPAASSYGVWIAGTASVVADYVSVMHSLGHGIITTSSNASSVNDSEIIGTAAKTSGAYPVYSGTTGKLVMTRCHISPVPYSSYTHNANVTAVDCGFGKPRIKSYPRNVYVVPHVDDAASLDYAEELEAVLAERGLRGGYYIEGANWDSSNNDRLRAMLSRGTMEICAHSWSHFDPLYVHALSVSFSGTGTPSITIESGLATFASTVGSEGFAVAITNTTTLQDIVDAKTSAWTFSKPTTDGQLTTKQYWVALASGLKYVSGVGLPALLDWDRGAAGRHVITEVTRTKTLLESILGDLVDPQTGQLYVCRSWGAPHNTYSSEYAAAGLTAGFTNMRADGRDTLISADLYHGNAVGIPADADDAASKYGGGAAIGGIYMLLSHSVTECTIEKWEQLLDAMIAECGNALTISSAGECVDLAKDAGTYGAGTGILSTAFAADGEVKNTGLPYFGTFQGGPTFGHWSTCDAPLPLSAQPCKGHALPIGTGKLTVFPGVATSSQIEEAK